MGALTVGVVTKPFSFEGQQRLRLAEQGLDQLKECVDSLIIIPNDRLLSTISKETTAIQAFAMCDEILKQAVEGISDLITTPGTIGNIDFADIRAVMENSGSALMGVGTANGDKRAEDAAKAAINSPLLDLSIHGAKGVLFSIAGSDDLTMFEIQDAAKMITESIDPSAKVIFGTVNDPKLKKGEVRVTVVAAGFPENAVKKTLFQVPAEPVEEKKSIFNNISPVMKREIKTEDIRPMSTPPSQQPPQKVNVDDDKDDDWGAVPAFLRRSKIK